MRLLKQARLFEGFAELQLVVDQQNLLPGESSESEDDVSNNLKAGHTGVHPDDHQNESADEVQEAQLEEVSHSGGHLEENEDLSGVDDESETKESETETETTSLSVDNYLMATKHTNKQHKWLCGYFEYLALPGAGYKKPKDRRQHPTQVRNLLKHLEPNGDDITCLANDSGDAVWKQWVHPHLEAQSKAPGTLISYLTSLEKFLKFVTSSKYD